jgi:CHAT domain
MASDHRGGYEDFRIRISGGPGRYDVRATCRGAAVSGTFERPFTDEGLELLILRTQARRGAIRAERRSEGVAAAREIGETLYRKLFQGVVGALLWKESEAVADGLRITLELSDVPELMDLPWEYLYDPDRGHFLAFSLRTPIVRYLDVPSRQRPFEVSPPLRMLAMISRPRDVIELNVEHEKALLDDALAGLVSRKLVQIDWLENGTRQALRQRLRRAAGNDPYHLFHYIGHGSFDESRGEGFLLFEDPHGLRDPIDGRYLGQMLYEHNSLRLAVLNACEGARAANPLNEPFAGVAARLVRNEIPAVIAMQFEVTDDAAALFSKSFYEAIARGEPVDSALVQSRQDLSDADPHGVEWGTPVLFMRVDDGKIFDVAEAGTDGVADAEEPLPDESASPAPVRRAPLPTQLEEAIASRRADDRVAAVGWPLGALAVLAGLAGLLALLNGVRVETSAHQSLLDPGFGGPSNFHDSHALWRLASVFTTLPTVGIVICALAGLLLAQTASSRGTRWLGTGLLLALGVQGTALYAGMLTSHDGHKAGFVLAVAGAVAVLGVGVWSYWMLAGAHLDKSDSPVDLPIRAIAAAGAVLTLVGMFVNFNGGGSGPGHPNAGSVFGKSSFERWDLLAVALLVFALLSWVGSRPLVAGVLIACGVGTALLWPRFIAIPALENRNIASIAPGGFIGLAGAVLIAVSGYAARRSAHMQAPVR